MAPPSPIPYGARVALYLNGIPYGAVEAVPSVRISTPSRPEYGLDSLVPHELIPGPVEVTFTLRVYRIVGGGPEVLGVGSSTTRAGERRYFAVELVDRLTDETLFSALQCSLDTQDWSFNRGLARGTLSCRAIVDSNESAAAF